MYRRDFVANSVVAFLASTLAESALGSDGPRLADQIGSHTGGEVADAFLLTSKLDEEVVEQAYKGRAPRGLEGSELPYLFLYFDEEKKKFANPLDVTPSLPPKAYSLEAKIHAFNIKRDQQDQFKNLKNEVQLGFNAKAPVTKTDELTWMFMNAVDIFLNKDKNRPDALTKFMGDNGTPLQANPKVSVVNGILELQITAFGQKKDGFWKRFINIVTSAASSPIVSDVSKGFSIPSLSTEALKFVNHVVNVFSEQEKLVPLWRSAGLTFAIHTDAKARFKMNQGLWIMVDSDYAHSTDQLDGHTIDLGYQSYRILDKNKKAVDANYLVTDLVFSD
jgi:hypothetical protein